MYRVTTVQLNMLRKLHSENATPNWSSTDALNRHSLNICLHDDFPHYCECLALVHECYGLLLEAGADPTIGMDSRIKPSFVESALDGQKTVFIKL